MSAPCRNNRAAASLLSTHRPLQIPHTITQSILINHRSNPPTRNRTMRLLPHPAPRLRRRLRASQGRTTKTSHFQTRLHQERRVYNPIHIRVPRPVHHQVRDLPFPPTSIDPPTPPLRILLLLLPAPPERAPGYAVQQILLLQERHTSR